MPYITARVDARLVGNWEAYASTMEDLLGAMYPNHYVMVLPTDESSWETPAKSIAAYPVDPSVDLKPALDVLDIPLLPRETAIKPLKIDYNNCKTVGRREPQFRYNDAMYDDYKPFIPKDDREQVSVDPVMGMRFK